MVKSLKGSGTRYLISTIVIMLLIFLHSAMPADVSSEESGVIVGLIIRFVKADPEAVTFAVRKTAHFLEYLLLGFSLAQLFRARLEFDKAEMDDCPVAITENTEKDCVRNSRTGCSQIGKSLISWLIGTAYACSDEIHQIFVPGRSCELRDVCIDAAGVACGCLLSYYLFKRHKRKYEVCK